MGAGFRLGRFGAIGVVVFAALARGAAAAAGDPAPPVAPAVGPVPAAVRAEFKLAPFYAQYASARGFPVVASGRVSPYAVREAAYLIDRMLGDRDDLRQAMVAAKVRFTVMARDELTTQVPEHSDLTPKNHWDLRARGLGATRARPSVSCGEENLLGLRGDPYRGENILIHEFAHAVHQMGVNAVDPTFDGRLKAAFDAAAAKGLWDKTYAATNRHEYFAEGVQSWFDANQAKGGVHNGVDTREKLKAHDPALGALIAEVFGDGAWRYVPPERRAAPGHLAGFDRAAAPAFAWPKELLEWKRNEAAAKTDKPAKAP